MRILVVAGTGFIGARVVAALAHAGHDVTVYHRGVHEPALPVAVRHVRGEEAAVPILRYPTELRRAGFDVVVHMVLVGERDAVAAAAAFRGVAGRLVAVSSGDVYRAYGELLGTEPSDDAVLAAAAAPSPLTEDAPLRRRLFPYGAVTQGPWGELRDYEKILVERVVLGAGDPAGVVLRLPKVYGPGDPQWTLARFAARFLDGRAAIVLGAAEAGWRWTHGYVDDVAAAIALAATEERAAGRVYNVGEAVTPSTGDRVRALAAAAGTSIRLVVTPDDALPRVMRPPMRFSADLVMSTARIRDELGYVETVDVGEALRRTVAWMRDAGPRLPRPSHEELIAEDEVLAAAV